MKNKFILGNCYLNKAEMVLTHFTPVALTFDLKTIGFICYLGWMCGPSLKKVVQGVLELLIGKEKVTDGETNMCKMPSLLRRRA